MSIVSLALLLGSIGLALYTYVGYPLILKLLAANRGPVRPAATPREWPEVTITLVAYNEAETIRDTLQRLLKHDYPASLRQILVISDGSSDGTDEIVAGFADRGVELLRMTDRRGKTAAENAALPYLRGDIIVNTDASVRIDPSALKRLIAAFADPSVGLASGSDISVASTGLHANLGESKYVGFEMWLRKLETHVYSIVGASGCFYAIRGPLHRNLIPEGLSRDFAAALITREHGYRAVSVNDAVCFVPRSVSMRFEYDRKVRTIARGLGTLLYKRSLLNPFRYGLFAWMLFSHKLCRWLVPLALVMALGAAGVLSVTEVWARWALAVAGGGLLLAGLGWGWPERPALPRSLAVPAYLLAGNIAALHAWGRALRGSGQPIWEPTRRKSGLEPRISG